MDVQPAASERTPLGDLTQLIADGVNPATLETCHGLASLFLDKWEICDELRAGVLSIVLQEILSNVIVEHRQQALDLLTNLSRGNASKTASFQVAAAAELLGLSDEVAFKRVDEHRTPQLGASWAELKEKAHNRGPLRECQLRAAIWLGDSSSRSGKRKKHKLLMALETAIEAYLAEQEIRSSFRARAISSTAQVKELSATESPNKKSPATSQSTTTATREVHNSELSVTDPDLHHVINNLAGIVRRQWHEEQIRRKENDPFLLSLRWKNAPRQYTTHWAAIRGVPENNQEITLDGALDGIAKTFMSVPSKRLVVLGQGGSGKTTLVMELLLKLLDPTQHSPVESVPVIFDLASWNPYQQSLRDWIAERLIADYQDLDKIIKQRGTFSDQEAAYVDYVLPILDGFDEIDPDLRTAAIRALNAYAGKMVMTSRAQEYYDAVDAGDIVLSRAAVIVLEDLTLHEISRYLPLTTRPLSDEIHSPTKWDPILSHMRSDPDDAQSAALLEVFSTPLMVSLARRIYSDTVANPTELLDRNRFSDATTLSDYLLDQFIHVTYDQLPQQKHSIKQYGAWRADKAQYRLTCFALYLHSLGVRGLSSFSGETKKTRSIKVPLPWSLTKLSQKVYRRLALLKIESERLDGAYLSLPSKKFLEDSCRRGVLRRSGANYEFRHVLLQDRLAYKTLIGDRRIGKRDFEYAITTNLIVVLFRRGRFAEAENLLKGRMALLLNPPWRRGKIVKMLPVELSIKYTTYGLVKWQMNVAGRRRWTCTVVVPRDVNVTSSKPHESVDRS